MSEIRSAAIMELERRVKRTKIHDFTDAFYEYIHSTESLTAIIPGMKRSGKNALIDQIITSYLQHTDFQIWFFNGQQSLLDAFEEYSKFQYCLIDVDTGAKSYHRLCDYIDMDRIHITSSIEEFEGACGLGTNDIVLVFDEGSLTDSTNAQKHNTNAATMLNRFLAISSHNRIHTYFLAQRMTMLNATIRALASFVIYRKLSPQNMNTIRTVARDSLVCNDRYSNLVQKLTHFKALFINEGELRANFGPDGSDQVGYITCELSPHWALEDIRYKAWRDEELEDGLVEIEGELYDGLTANRFSEQFRGMKVSDIESASERKSALASALISEMATDVINTFGQVTHSNQEEARRAFSYLRSKHRMKYNKGMYECVIDVVKEWNRLELIESGSKSDTTHLKKSLDLEKLLLPGIKKDDFFQDIREEYNAILYEISQSGQIKNGECVNKLAVKAWRYKHEQGYTVQRAATTAGYSSGPSGSGAIKRVQGKFSHRMGHYIERVILKDLMKNPGFKPVLLNDGDHPFIGGTGQPDIVLKHEQLDETWIIEVKHTISDENLSLAGKKYRASMREAFNILYEDGSTVRFFIICVSLKYLNFYCVEMPLEPRHLMQNKALDEYIEQTLSEE